jgi:hypothetical protein
MTSRESAAYKRCSLINPLETILGDQWANLCRWDHPCSLVNNATP